MPLTEYLQSKYLPCSRQHQEITDYFSLLTELTTLEHKVLQIQGELKSKETRRHILATKLRIAQKSQGSCARSLRRLDTPDAKGKRVKTKGSWNSPTQPSPTQSPTRPWSVDAGWRRLGAYTLRKYFHKECSISGYQRTLDFNHSTICRMGSSRTYGVRVSKSIRIKMPTWGQPPTKTQQFISLARPAFEFSSGLQPCWRWHQCHCRTGLPLRCC